VNLDEREPSPEHQPYEDPDDDLDDGGDWTRDRSPTPVHGDNGGAGSSPKPRKHLLKKSGGGDMPSDDGLDDFGLADEDADPSAEERKRKGHASKEPLFPSPSARVRRRRSALVSPPTTPRQ
jgi:transcription factor SPN1